jgi:hypothetical protein
MRTREKWGRQNRTERFWTSLIASGAAIRDGPAGAPAKDGKAQSHPLRGPPYQDGDTPSVSPFASIPLQFTHGYPQTLSVHRTLVDPAWVAHGASGLT